MKPFNSGIDVTIKKEMDMIYGKDVFGPIPEKRRLDDIRKSLKDPHTIGPETVYSIAMDVGKEGQRIELEERMLLFGIVTFAAGSLGHEPIKSQGHVHKVSKHSGWSPPELYQIWEGEAIIYMQESTHDFPGRCYAIYASPGDIVLVPPHWAHATISSNPKLPLTFGAFCDREYGFEYEAIRAHQGLAWYPLFDESGHLYWEQNKNYHASELIKKKPNHYSMLNISKGTSIYKQFESNPDAFQFISKPYLQQDDWESFVP